MSLPPPPPPPPPLPRLSLASVARLRTKICDEVAYPFYDDVMEGAAYAGLVAGLTDLLAGRGVAPHVVAEACRPVAGATLTRSTLFAFAWRVAGNLDMLKAGVAPGPSPVPTRPAWVPFQVLASLQTATFKGLQGSEFRLRALAGACCPAVVTKTWARAAYTFVARDLGFTRRGGTMPFQHPSQLVGLRFFGLVEPERTRDGKPDFRQVRASGSMLAYNRAVLARRFRVGVTGRCPFGYNDAAFVPCHRCAVGYAGKDGVDACVAACHAARYAFRPCPACGEAAAPFDPAASATTCLPCTVRRRTNPEK